MAAKRMARVDAEHPTRRGPKKRDAQGPNHLARELGVRRVSASFGDRLANEFWEDVIRQLKND